MSEQERLALANAEIAQRLDALKAKQQRLWTVLLRRLDRAFCLAPARSSAKGEAE